MCHGHYNLHKALQLHSGMTWLLNKFAPTYTASFYAAYLAREV